MVVYQISMDWGDDPPLGVSHSRLGPGPQRTLEEERPAYTSSHRERAPEGTGSARESSYEVGDLSDWSTGYYVRKLYLMFAAWIFYDSYFTGECM